jgi:hypothetical protein
MLCTALSHSHGDNSQSIAVLAKAVVQVYKDPGFERQEGARPSANGQRAIQSFRRRRRRRCSRDSTASGSTHSHNVNNNNRSWWRGPAVENFLSSTLEEADSVNNSSAIAHDRPCSA